MSGSLYTHWHYTDYSCTPFPIPAPRVPVPFYSRYRNSRVVLTDLKSDLPLERRASSETSCVVSTPYSCTEDSRGSSALSGLRTPSSTRSTSSSTFDAIRGSGRDDIRARNRFIDRGRRGFFRTVSHPPTLARRRRSVRRWPGVSAPTRPRSQSSPLVLSSSQDNDTASGTHQAKSELWGSYESVESCMLLQSRLQL